MDEAKVKAMVENIKNLMEVHNRQRENYVKLFKLCLQHLRDRRRLIPKEVWAEREKLIEALEQITMLGTTNEGEKQ